MVKFKSHYLAISLSRGLVILLAFVLIIQLLLNCSIVKLFAASCNTADCSSPEDCQQKIKECEEIINAYIPAQTKNKETLAQLEKQLGNLEKLIKVAEGQIKKLEEEIFNRTVELEYQREIFNTRVRSYYIRSQQFSPFLIFLASESAGNLTRELSYRLTVANEDKKVIIKIASELAKLEQDKEKLAQNKAWLAKSKENTAKQAAFLKSEVKKMEEFLGEVKGKIAALTARQQALLAEKFASVPVPRLAYTSLRGCSSDIGKDPGFSPRFGFFSYGVPNKTGLNQYGAKGRAEAGQTVEEILQAYYKNFQIVDYGTNFNIRVNGINEYGQVFNNEEMNIEEYLKHLYEMPTSWHPNALKAQAIAARTYALYATKNGQKSISPDQYGQVIKKEINDSQWQEAVDSTRGKVMVHNGSPIGAWYSSTHGGVILSSGQIGWNDSPWTKYALDTPSGSASSFSDLKLNAYDKQSPWFFCNWGYRKQYNNTAWLKEEEVVDIVNSYILWEKDNSKIIHLSQTDRPTSDTWSAERVRQEIGNSAINSISSIYVEWDESGISKTIRINGRAFDAQKFKNMFNLRAPGNIQIKPACQPDSALNCPRMYALYEVIKEY